MSLYYMLNLHESDGRPRVFEPLNALYTRLFPYGCIKHQYNCISYRALPVICYFQLPGVRFEVEVNSKAVSSKKRSSPLSSYGSNILLRKVFEYSLLKELVT